MGRTYRKPRSRAGRGTGERFSEVLIFIVLGAGLIYGLRWYFVVFKNSATTALIAYVGGVKAGDPDVQYKLLNKASKAAYPTQDEYVSKFKMAQGLHGRMKDFTITKISELGDKAEADVTVFVRKEKQEIYQAAADEVKDHYVLVKEDDGWKVALDQCYDKIHTMKYVER